MLVESIARIELIRSHYIILGLGKKKEQFEATMFIVCDASCLIFYV